MEEGTGELMISIKGFGVLSPRNVKAQEVLRDHPSPLVSPTPTPSQFTGLHLDFVRSSRLCFWKATMLVQALVQGVGGTRSYVHLQPLAAGAALSLTGQTSLPNWHFSLCPCHTDWLIIWNYCPNEWPESSSLVYKVLTILPPKKKRKKKKIQSLRFGIQGFLWSDSNQVFLFFPNHVFFFFPRKIT